MSGSVSNTAANKDVDPYRAHNFEDVPLEQKITDLANLVSELKFGMLTTKLSSDSDLLASRCMALAAQARCASSFAFKR